MDIRDQIISYARQHGPITACHIVYMLPQASLLHKMAVIEQLVQDQVLDYQVDVCPTGELHPQYTLQPLFNNKVITTL